MEIRAHFGGAGNLPPNHWAKGSVLEDSSWILLCFHEHRADPDKTEPVVSPRGAPSDLNNEVIRPAVACLVLQVLSIAYLPLWLVSVKLPSPPFCLGHPVDWAAVSTRSRGWEQCTVL
jgi:hypothetical protein